MMNTIGSSPPCYGAGSSGSCPNGTGADKLTAPADAKNQTTSYSYDLLSRLASETDPLEKSTGDNYDAAGNLTSKTDANGITIGYAYDNQDFLGLFFYLQLVLSGCIRANPLDPRHPRSFALAVFA